MRCDGRVARGRVAGTRPHHTCKDERVRHVPRTRHLHRPRHAIIARHALCRRLGMSAGGADLEIADSRASQRQQ